MHALFDGCEIIFGKSCPAVKIIIKAIFNGRADCDLCFREKLKHSFGHHMRTIMPKQGQCSVIFRGDKGNRGIGLDRPRQIPLVTINHSYQRRFC